MGLFHKISGLLKLHDDLIYLQGQANGFLCATAIAIGLYILFIRPPGPPRYGV